MSGRQLPPVGIGDLVDVVRALDLRGEAIATAAELLRLRPFAAPAPAVREPAAETVPALIAPVAVLSDAPSVTVITRPPEGVAAIPVSALRTPAQVTTAPLASRSLAELLPPGPPAPPPRGLFASGTRRALLRGVTAVRAPEGDIDVDAVLEQLAGNRALEQLPLEWIETTRGEVQLLLDTGIAMDPFRRDVDRLPGELARVVGEDGLTPRWFEDCPAGPAGVMGVHDRAPVPFRLPAAGQRLLVVTTFGVRGELGASPDVPALWRRLGRACRRARIPLLALTPLPPRRVPAVLAGQLAIVTWDRTSSVRDVRRAVRKARRR